MNHTYSLRNLAAALLGRLRFIVICTLLCGLTAFLAARFWMPFRYEAYASMYVRNSVTSAADHVNLSDLNASKSLVGTYIAVLTSQSVMEEVSRQLCVKLDEETLWTAYPGASVANPPNVARSVRMSDVNSTEVLRITANTKSPEVSAQICNILADIAPNFLIRVVGAGSVEVIDHAVPIYRPVSPNIPLLTLGGLFAGLAVAVLLVLLMDFFDDTVRDTEKLTKTFDKPILGEIQSADGDADERPSELQTFWKGVRSMTRGRKSSKKRTESAQPAQQPRRRSHRAQRKLITDENIPFSVVEGYKSIRTNIVFSLGAAQSKAILISSANPDEGKSTTAANTALAFAQISNRVLLIDADMRKPVMHRTFLVDNSTGLSTLIISLSSMESSIRRHVMGDLDLLPSGPLPPNPSELLSSAQFRELLERLAERYDYIIIDTPPVNMVSDAIAMRHAVGGIMFVIRYGRTTYEELSEAMKKVNLSGSNMLGFVVNDVPRPHTSYYNHYRYRYGGRSYSYAYGYGYGYSRRRNRNAANVSVKRGADAVKPTAEPVPTEAAVDPQTLFSSLVQSEFETEGRDTT